MNTIWTPQPKQIEFMRRGEDEALYGGAAGGGKSDAIVVEALRQVGIAHYKGLILRKTFPQLAELVDKTLNYYPKAFPRAVYNSSRHCWTFPSGAKIYFGAMQHTKDKLKYQGQAFDFIAFDELTHFTFEEYSYLFSRNRPNGPGTRCYMRATANPGGIGHGWVKERFINPAPPMTTIWEDVKIKYPDGHEEKRKKSRIFVPAGVFDNPKMLDNDPDYLTRLASLPDAERAALLYGDWNSFSGQVFTEWKNIPDHYHDRLGTHVIAPFIIPDDWAVICSMDWGFAKPFSVGWYAVDHNRRIYRIREYYGCADGERSPDVGVQLQPYEVAEKILEIEKNDPNLKDRYIRRIGDPAIWGTQSGQSIGGMFADKCVYFEKADNARLDGKMQLHYRLAFDDEARPMLYVFNTCRNFLRTLPALVYSQVDPEDVDTTQEDHAYDECRYVCMANPLAPRKLSKIPAKPYDPLSSDSDISYDPYEFYR